MKRPLRTIVTTSSLLAIVSMVVLAEGAPPFEKRSVTELHCTSGYIDCDTLEACVAEASSRDGEADCIAQAVAPLVDEGFSVVADADEKLTLRDVPDGKQTTSTLLGSRLGIQEVLSAPSDPLVFESTAGAVTVVSGKGAVIDPIRQTIHTYQLGEVTAPQAADAGVEGDAGAPLPVESAKAAPAPPPPKKPEVEPPKVDMSQFQDVDALEEKKPFSKGDMEVSLGLGLAGDGNASYFSVGGKYAYYVINRLAPGIDINYTHIFVDDALKSEFMAGYPDSLTLLPFLKYVITQKTVAPYVFVKGGYDFEWGTSTAVNAWVLGLGGGVHVTVAKRFTINIELTALHYWYSSKKQYWYNDDDLYSVEGKKGQKVLWKECNASGDCKEYVPDSKPDTNGDDPAKVPDDSAETSLILLDKKGNKYECTNPDNCPIRTDKKDVEREWFFPLVTLGFGVVF